MTTEAITQKVDVVLRGMSPSSLSTLDTEVLSELTVKAIRISTILREFSPILEEEDDLLCWEDTPRVFFSPDKEPYIGMAVHLPGRYGFLDATSNYLFAYEGEQINGEALMVLAFQGKATAMHTVVLEATGENLPDVLKELISF